jgi:hypothetical protein
MRFTIPLTLACALGVTAATAQGISESEIIGEETDIRTIRGDINSQTVTALIDGSRNAADEIRMTTAPDMVTLVKLGERRTVVTDEIDRELRDNDAILADLRNAVQINSVLVEILNRHDTGVPEVVAADVTDNDGIVLYVFAEQGEG